MNLRRKLKVDHLMNHVKLLRASSLIIEGSQPFGVHCQWALETTMPLKAQLALMAAPLGNRSMLPAY